MVIFLRKPKLILIMFAFAVASVIAIFSFQTIHDNKLENVPVSLENQTLENTALVRLFMNAIQEQSNLFYEPYYTIHPNIVDYWTTIKDIDKNGSQIHVTFSTLPYIGPHDTIGEDDITFSINCSGDIAMLDFKHLKSYPLPEHLKSIEKGSLPPITE